ncbi:hypothetical protein [Aliiroseovarius marinus]|uniref:hypothetical protein n=1 Tax=Aliiroseovarius marinus TaxID=2500159 RepID=UPI003D7C7F09
MMVSFETKLEGSGMGASPLHVLPLRPNTYEHNKFQRIEAGAYKTDRMSDDAEKGAAEADLSKGIN